MIRATPDDKRPTHHVMLSDGEIDIGLVVVNTRGDATPNAITRAPVARTALKTTTGNQTYADFEPPWTPVAQEDWSGGRGQSEYERDTTRFYDSYRAQTMFSNKAFLAPQETYMTGHRKQDSNVPGSVSWNALIPGNRKYLAVKFAASDTYSIAYIYLYIRRVGTPATALTVELCSNSGDEPSTVLKSATVTTSDITDVVSQFYRCAITAQAVTGSTSYWIKAYSDGDNDNHWEVGVSSATGTSKQSSNGSTWTASGIDLYYRATDAGTTYSSSLFFKLQYQNYAILNTDGSAPTLWINGDRGVADANTGALTTLQDATKTWTTNAWAGCVVYIYKGAGQAEAQPWRTITGNDASVLTVSPAWTITHDITTEYVILGSNKWTEVTGHGLTVSVTDTCTVNNVAYLCQGDSVNYRRMTITNTAGVFAYAYGEDSSAASKAVFMESVRDATAGLLIWRALNKDATSDISVSKATPVTWGTELTWGTAITFKDSFGKITGLEEYDDPKKLWIMREGSVFAASGTTADEISLTEIHNVAEWSNGRGHMTHNVYLYFNVGDGLERYYNKLLDDIGPNRDEGMPSDYKGVIVSMCGYPGRFFAAIDGGTSNYSSILGYNGTGWHSIYRAPMKGQRIRAITFDVVPGTAPDRLIAQMGSDFVWLSFPSMTLNPLQDTSATYTQEGVITLSWMNSGMFDVWKFYHSIKVFAENLSADDGQTIAVDYRLDNETDWTTMEDVFDTSPMEEIAFDELGLSGKRIQLRIRMLTTDNTKTPLLKSAVIENVSRVPVKYSYGFAFRAKDDDVDLHGEREAMTAQDKLDKIDEWASNLTPLTMRCIRRAMDDKVIFIDPSVLTPYVETSEGYIGKLTVVEI